MSKFKIIKHNDLAGLYLNSKDENYRIMGSKGEAMIIPLWAFDVINALIKSEVEKAFKETRPDTSSTNPWESEEDRAICEFDVELEKRQKDYLKKL